MNYYATTIPRRVRYRRDGLSGLGQGNEDLLAQRRAELASVREERARLEEELRALESRQSERDEARAAVRVRGGPSPAAVAQGADQSLPMEVFVPPPPSPRIPYGWIAAAGVGVLLVFGAMRKR